MQCCGDLVTEYLGKKIDILNDFISESMRFIISWYLLKEKHIWHNVQYI